MSANKLRSFSTSPLEWFSGSVSEVVLNATAKPSCFNVQVIKKKQKKNQSAEGAAGLGIIRSNKVGETE